MPNLKFIFNMALDQQELNPAASGVSSERLSIPEAGLPGQEKITPPERSPVEAGKPAERGRGENAPSVMPQPQVITQATPYAPAADESYIKYKQIEKVLEEDLGEIYNNLTPQEQKNFKIKGEEAARSIFQLVYHKTKIKVKKIVKLIKNWLKSVPGINKFFLEQEAKIKADKIAALADESKKVEF